MIIPGTAATSPPTVCPKCAINQDSGKLTCCARGGSWHGKCGDTTSPKFDYTWAMGNMACKSKSPGHLAQAPRQTNVPDAKSTVKAPPDQPTQTPRQTKAPYEVTLTLATKAVAIIEEPPNILPPPQPPCQTKVTDAKSITTAPQDQPTQAPRQTEAPDAQGKTTRNPSGKRDTHLYYIL